VPCCDEEISTIDSVEESSATHADSHILAQVPVFVHDSIGMPKRFNDDGMEVLIRKLDVDVAVCALGRWRRRTGGLTLTSRESTAAAATLLRRLLTIVPAVLALRLPR
jgi:hypothetical protein